MSSTAFDDQPFERVVPTWEAGRPGPQRPASTSPTRAGRIALAVGMALTALTVAAIAGTIIAGFALGLPMSSGIGERTPRPQSAAALAQGFELTAGELRVDLRDVRLPAGTTRTKVDVAYGQATVIVPPDVDVVVDGRVDAGQVTAFGRQDDGWGVDSTQAVSAGRTAPTLVIDGHVGFGELRVERGA